MKKRVIIQFIFSVHSLGPRRREAAAQRVGPAADGRRLRHGGGGRREGRRRGGAGKAAGGGPRGLGPRQGGRAKEANELFIFEMNNFEHFWNLGSRFGRISANFDTFWHFRRRVAKFRSNFIKIDRKNGKLCLEKVWKTRHFEKIHFQIFSV